MSVFRFFLAPRLTPAPRSAQLSSSSPQTSPETTTRGHSLWAAAALVLVTSMGSAQAYEPGSTHAGLTEQAATHSKLHERLSKQFGQTRGLFEPLIVPPADAVALMKVLRRFSPTHGFVPDGRGKQTALAWLVAGSAVATSPPSHAVHHFFDPASKKGLSAATIHGATMRLRRRRFDAITHRGNPSDSSALKWLVDPKNPMGIAGFHDQYAKAVRARTAGERSRHLAGALIAAGATLNLLQDMGSPSRVRDDMAAHLQRVSNDRQDIASRFERVASLAYGRLGIPSAAGSVGTAGTLPTRGTATRRNSLRAFFTDTDGLGLADITSRRWFSDGTLPKPIHLQGGQSSKRLAVLLERSVARPAPMPLPRLDLFTAARSQATLVDENGTCVARYMVRDNVLSWSIDDPCRLEQLASILPMVSAYSAGLLDYLFRGSIVIFDRRDHVSAAADGAAFGAGTLSFFWDDLRGVRQQYSSVNVTGADMGKSLGRAPRPPAEALRVSVLFVGVDSAGEPLSATGQLAITRRNPKDPQTP